MFNENAYDVMDTAMHIEASNSMATVFFFTFHTAKKFSGFDTLGDRE